MRLPCTHINVTEAILRSPIELKEQYESAKKLVGTLTEVNGGYCTYHAFCFAQFACNGCKSESPRPKKKISGIREKKMGGGEGELCSPSPPPI